MQNAQSNQPLLPAIGVSGYQISCLKPETIVNTLSQAATSLYMGEIDKDGLRQIDPELLGKTNLEVLSIRLAEKAASGDLAATNMLLDRLMGKPKQYVESTTMNVSYSDFLDSINPPEKQREQHGTILDIELNDTTLYDEIDAL